MTKKYWWRLWRNGPGLSWCPVAHPKLFSERYGYSPSIEVCGWRFRYLRRVKP